VGLSEFAVELHATPTAPGSARAFVRDHWADRAGADVLDAVGLCVSELVTNAIDHASPPYHLTLRSHDQTLRIEVADATAVGPVMRSQQPFQARGRGIFLVDQLARAWGVLPSDHGKTVWAEF
jgi:two-component sensor histidine kinase